MTPPMFRKVEMLMSEHSLYQKALNILLMPLDFEEVL